jgi:hypothetical protein
MKIRQDSCGFERRSRLCATGLPKIETWRKIRIKDEGSNIYSQGTPKISKKMYTRKFRIATENRGKQRLSEKLAQKLKEDWAEKTKSSWNEGIEPDQGTQNPVQELEQETEQEGGGDTSSPATPMRGFFDCCDRIRILVSSRS